MLTSDINEAVMMGHRIIVLFHGKIIREYKRGEAAEEDVLRTAIGADESADTAAAGAEAGSEQTGPGAKPYTEEE
jgi:ABC-type uncharacterized transport system ATPase component